MIQEEKDLLFKDLCARLPYGVKIDIPDLFVSTKNNIEVLKEIFCGDDGEFRCNDSGMLIKHVKPYLFPLSSMSEDQKYEFYLKFFANDCDFDYFKFYLDNGRWHKLLTSLLAVEEIIDWFHKNHIDYRGLIPMGLANNAIDKNIY